MLDIIISKRYTLHNNKKHATFKSLMISHCHTCYTVKIKTSQLKVAD